MKIIKEINKEIFKTNLISTVTEIQRSKGLEFEKYRFLIHPVEEKNKTLNSADEFMRLGILNQENIGDKKLKINDVVNVLGGIMPLSPIFISKMKAIQKKS